MSNFSYPYFSESQSYLKDRTRFFKNLVTKELTGVGCTDFDYFIYKTMTERKKWWESSEVKEISLWIEFTFKNERWKAFIEVPTCDKYCYHSRKPYKTHIYPTTGDKKGFFIDDIRINLGEKFTKKYTREITLPLYESLRPTYEHLKAIFEENN